MPPSDPYAIPGNHDDRSITHGVRVDLKQEPHDIRSFIRSHVNQPHDAGMRQALQEHQLSEILVLGNKHAILFKGEQQNLIVPRLRQTVANGRDIATGVLQRCKNRS